VGTQRVAARGLVASRSEPSTVGPRGVRISRRNSACGVHTSSTSTSICTRSGRRHGVRDRWFESNAAFGDRAPIDVMTGPSSISTAFTNTSSRSDEGRATTASRLANGRRAHPPALRLAVSLAPCRSRRAEADLRAEQLTSALPVPRAQWCGKHAEFIMRPSLLPARRLATAVRRFLQRVFARKQRRPNTDTSAVLLAKRSSAAGFFRRQHIIFKRSARYPIYDATIRRSSIRTTIALRKSVDRATRRWRPLSSIRAYATAAAPASLFSSQAASGRYAS